MKQGSHTVAVCDLTLSPVGRSVKRILAGVVFLQLLVPNRGRGVTWLVLQIS